MPRGKLKRQCSAVRMEGMDNMRLVKVKDFKTGRIREINPEFIIEVVTYPSGFMKIVLPAPLEGIEIDYPEWKRVSGELLRQ